MRKTTLYMLIALVALLAVGIAGQETNLRVEVLLDEDVVGLGNL